MSRLNSLTHWQEGITLAELVPLLAAVLLSHPTTGTGQLWCTAGELQPVPLHPPAPGWRLKVLPELLSNACSEMKTTEKQQENTNGWQGPAIPK